MRTAIAASLCLGLASPSAWAQAASPYRDGAWAGEEIAVTRDHSYGTEVYERLASEADAQPPGEADVAGSLEATESQRH